ncbi:palmdelphin-like isoform X1 [Pseudochaenichthys georgianus]|uniref:palmdelphin-like isoform X1 n=1 Tax=Pseudochaenichthys georgianus TaxID=52239 RepID=UPI00146F3587|nr:palmdelphin isoform X1 [Pseudochaenichthys georgianus]
MEECVLLKERLQAITEKHYIQEEMRQKKLELDQEKLKLQHIKKKALREQWLLQDSTSHNATDYSQQQSLQLNIHRIEMEVKSLEREESKVSTKESFILNRLKTVEKSAGDIIKEAQDSFVHEPLQVTTVTHDVLHSYSTPANNHSEASKPRRTLFAMEISVTKDLKTGKSTVLSTAAVPAEELSQQAGLKVYDDGRKCVYALNSQEGSHDQGCVSELTANEVEHLLRSATMLRQVKQQNVHLSHSRSFSNHQQRRGEEERFDLRDQQRYYGIHPIRDNMTEKDCRGKCLEKAVADQSSSHDSHYRRHEDRNNKSNMREGHRHGSHKGMRDHDGNQKDCHHSSHNVRNGHRVQEDRPASHHKTSIGRSNRVVNGGRARDCPPPRSHDQEAVSAYQPQLSYTPANHIPLSDYISVDEEELYSCKPASYHRPSTAMYTGPAPSDRVPSPLYGDDTHYTILNAIDTTEPITAIFMGFKMAQDESGRGHKFESCPRAELVIIEDEDNSEDTCVEEKQRSSSTGSSATGSVGHAEGVGHRRKERRGGPGIRKVLRSEGAGPSLCEELLLVS